MEHLALHIILLVPVISLPTAPSSNPKNVYEEVGFLDIFWPKSTENPDVSFYKRRLVEKDKSLAEMKHERDDLIRNNTILQKDIVSRESLAEMKQHERDELIRNNTILQKDIEQLEIIALKVLPYLSIRQKIEDVEALYGPELRTKLGDIKLGEIQDIVNYHTKFCAALLQKKDNRSIKRILEFIKEEHITNDEFCLSTGSFFGLSSDMMHVPALTQYTEKQLIDALTYHLGFLDPTTLSTARVIWKI